MSTRAQIKIYTNEACPYCKQIKEELTKNNIDFDELLTNDNKLNWQAVVALTNIPNVPTIEFNNDFFVPGRDFTNPQHLVNRLKSFKKSKYTDAKQSHEKIKTLNYNMSVAFSKIDQILTKIENKIK